MSLSNMPEVNSIGGLGGFGVPGASFGGGFGGGGLIEGLILASLLGRGGRGGLFGGGGECGESASLDADGIAAKVVALQNSTNILAAIQDAKDSATLGTLAISDAVKDGNYAAAIQAERNTAQLSAQAQAIAVAAEQQADRNAAAILSRINQTEVDNLRDQLHGERRRGDAREVEINITNSANAVQNQMQAQFQLQRQDAMQRDFDIERRFSIIGNQVAKASQDVVNIGGLMTGTAQTSNPVNVK